MVADGVHIVLAVALVIAVLRTDRLEPYLIAVLTAGLPDLDRYMFVPFAHTGYLSGPTWSHRGITHSLAVFLLLVAAGYLIGHWRAVAIGYGSHLVADYLTGGIRLFAPFTDRLYGLSYDWMLANAVAGTFAVLVTLAGIAMLLRRDAGPPDDSFGQLSWWWFQ